MIVDLELTPAEKQAYAALAVGPPFQLRLRPIEAAALVTILQVMVRHPALHDRRDVHGPVPTDLGTWAIDFGRHLQALLVNRRPDLQRSLEAGWAPHPTDLAEAARFLGARAKTCPHCTGTLVLLWQDSDLFAAYAERPEIVDLVTLEEGANLLERWRQRGGGTIDDDDPDPAPA